jgi:hypothetical protein
MTDQSADCHYGDHEWRGGSVCIRGCGSRLRCICNCFVRADNMGAHVQRCRTVKKEEDDYRALVEREVGGFI